MPKGDGKSDGDKSRGDRLGGIGRRLFNIGSDRVEEGLRTKKLLLERMVRETNQGRAESLEVYTGCERAFGRVTDQNIKYYLNQMELREVVTELQKRSSFLHEDIREIVNSEFAYQLASGERLTVFQQYKEALLQNEMDTITGQQARIEFYALLCKKRLQGEIDKEQLQQAVDLIQQERRAWNDFSEATASRSSVEEEKLRGAMSALKGVIGEIAPGTPLERTYREMITDRENRSTIAQERNAVTSEAQKIIGLIPPGHIIGVIESVALDYARDDIDQYIELFDRDSLIARDRLAMEVQRNPQSLEVAAFQSVATTYMSEAHDVERNFQRMLKVVEDYIERAEAVKKRGGNIDEFKWPGSKNQE